MPALDSSEVGQFGFGGAKAEAFDPNATGFEATPPGKHLMELVDYKLELNHPFKLKGSTYTLHQFRPRFRVVDGRPFGGSSVMDFLPLPTDGAVMPELLANRFVNFAKALGFTVNSDSVIPVELRNAQGNVLDQFKGRRACVTVEYKTNPDTGQYVLDDSGTPRTEVKFFGYDKAQNAPDDPTAGMPAPPPPAQRKANTAESAKTSLADKL